MSMQVQDFQAPVVISNAEQEKTYADEWTNRFGILVGGSASVPWDGIGEKSVGHHIFERRVWKSFVKLQVGIRNEFEGALDLPVNAIQKDWATNEARKKWKSPRACAGDVLASVMGFCVPSVLIGHPEPEKLAEKVWPRAVRDRLKLWHPTGECQIRYFETFQTDDDQEAQLASQLLEAAYTTRNSIQEYVRMLKTEIESEKGLKNLNESLKELFAEIGEPLPEHKTALVAQEMGKEIVKAGQGDGRKDDAIIGALNAITARLERIEGGTPLANGSGPETEASDMQTSSISPRLRADGKPDGRFKGKE